MLVLANQMPGLLAAEVVSFNESDTTAAGFGCVGGFIGNGNRVSYYRGSTDELNRKLLEIKSRDDLYKNLQIELNIGEGRREHPIANAGNRGDFDATTAIAVDWVTWDMDPNALTSETKLFERSLILKDAFKTPVVPPLRNPSKARHMLVLIWINDRITLPKLEIPDGFRVRAADDIYRVAAFVDALKLAK
jgi:hypothetical protein